MTNTQMQALVGRILADAADTRIDDAAFRQRAKRAAARIGRALGEGARAGRAGRRAAAKAPPRYAFIAVPTVAGGVASISMPRPTYEALAAALGGAEQVNAMARKVALGHRPASGLSRSGYVRRRLQQLAARAGAPVK